MNKLMKLLGVCAAMVLGAASLSAATKPPAKKPAAKVVAKAPAPDWTKTVRYLPTGSILRGNPAAKVKLVEYISYTCPHCAHFNGEAGATLATSYIKPGKVQVEIRSFFRNVFDVAVSLVAHCGPASRFMDNHDAILAAQDTWIQPALHPTLEMHDRWMNPDFGQRMKAIADDLGLTGLMQARGYTDPQITACTANRPLAEKMANLTEQAGTVYKVEGTPSFLINNQLQTDVYDWTALRPMLDKSVR